MFGRLFGRGKDDTLEPTCSSCGRTLLAGEWTQRIVGGGDEELLLCSLCARERPESEGEPLTVSAGSTSASRVREPRADSDAFWRALKEKDAEIERLESQLAHTEAQRQELAGELARLKAGVGGPPADEAPLMTGPEAEAGEPAAADSTVEPAPPQAEVSETAAEPAAVEEPSVDRAAIAAETTAELTVSDMLDEPEEAAQTGDDAGVERTAEEIAADAASLTLLQRGVDLLNVSPVPRKIAETNESLGIPSVHVGFDGHDLIVTFLWALGWYSFKVDLEGAGSVSLLDRGYEERRDLQPNAGVRGDGTVLLAPARIKRAAPSTAAAEAAHPTPPAPVGTQPQPTAADVSPEIISKSLMGQRTDDEPLSWEQTHPRDFDWDR
jgi:hypothetical protein